MSTAVATSEQTLLEALISRIRACNAAPDGVALPAAILWTDPDRQWLPLIDVLRQHLSELLVLDEYDPEKRCGPAIWMRCVVDGALTLPDMPADRPPVLYLPGVARQQLRAGDDCPRALRPLVELMYRGTVWLQRAGHDWTVTAFMSSPQALGLDLSRDQATLGALLRALREVAETPLTHLRGRRLEADDFDRLLTDDLDRDLLRWMSDPDGSHTRMGAERWEAFWNQCRARLDFDPEKHGAIEAGQRLGLGEGAWADVWSRFSEAPRAYPGIPALLRKSKPATFVFEKSRWPDENETEEDALCRALAELPSAPHREACERVLRLEEQHGPRRQWLWAHLDQAPLAEVLEPLAMLARQAMSTVGGSMPDEIASAYTEMAWRADAASLDAIARTPVAHEALVHNAVRRLLLPWQDECARVFQRAVEQHPLPTHRNAETVLPAEGTCVLFVDGLRYDLGRKLASKLEARDCLVTASHRWAALPSVTATARPAVTPVAKDLRGTSLPDDFCAVFSESSRQAGAVEQRKAMTAAGYQVITSDLDKFPGTEKARGWWEAGNIDRMGHQLGERLPKQLDDDVDRIAERVAGLLEAGWRAVRVVTDHGWLLVPGGLPKIDLPKHLTASRWARCAVITGGSQVSVPTAPWHWNPDESFATAPGVACFNISPVYAHGGISIQECLTPDLLVEREEPREAFARIEDISWRGMRCTVQALVKGGAVQADLRIGGPHGRSIVASLKELDASGRASLLVEDDRHEDADALFVLIASDGTVVAQLTTRVGE
jgi:hypothetical protein